MGLLGDVLLAPFTGPVHGLKFVLNALRQQAEAESGTQEDALREELVALNMRLELGELTDEEFAAEEAALLEKIKAARASSESNEEEVHT